MDRKFFRIMQRNGNSNKGESAEAQGQRRQSPYLRSEWHCYVEGPLSRGHFSYSITFKPHQAVIRLTDKVG